MQVINNVLPFLSHFGILIIMFKEFIEPIVIKESYVDFYGHINNAKYIQLFEEARWEICTAAGLDIKSIQKSGVGPVVLGVDVEFRREISAREKINVHTQFIDFEQKVSLLEQKMVKEDGEVACLAKFKIGIWNLENRKLILPTKEWRLAFGFVE